MNTSLDDKQKDDYIEIRFDTLVADSDATPLLQRVEQTLAVSGRNPPSRFDILTHIFLVMPALLQAPPALIPVCTVAPFNLHQLCIHTHIQIH